MDTISNLIIILIIRTIKDSLCFLDIYTYFWMSCNRYDDDDKRDDDDDDKSDDDK